MSVEYLLVAVPALAILALVSHLERSNTNADVALIILIGLEAVTGLTALWRGIGERDSMALIAAAIAFGAAAYTVAQLRRG